RCWRVSVKLSVTTGRRVTGPDDRAPPSSWPDCRAPRRTRVSSVRTRFDAGTTAAVRAWRGRPRGAYRKKSGSGVALPCRLIEQGGRRGRRVQGACRAGHRDADHRIGRLAPGGAQPGALVPDDQQRWLGEVETED